MADSINGPFALAAAAWGEMLLRAMNKKNERFNPQAAECLQYYSGPNAQAGVGASGNDKFFTPPTDALGIADSDVVVRLNKVSQVVQIFGPVLYHRNPTRRMETRAVPPTNPNLLAQLQPEMVQQLQQVVMAAAQEQAVDKVFGQIFETLLNVTPHKTDLKTESRKAINEALITGLGLMWCEDRVSPATGRRTVGSWYHSVRDFLVDPDATDLKGIQWCAKRTVMHVWEAERKWNIPPGRIKTTLYSNNGMGAEGTGLQGNGQPRPDMVEVWEVYSKMGCGGRLQYCNHVDEADKAAYELLGDFCYLAIVRGHPWPLNLPPWMFLAENTNAWTDAVAAVQWPIPFWIDNDDGLGWPFTPIYFHSKPNDPWPLSHMSFAMGPLKFMNWVFGKVATKVAVTSRDLLFIADELSDAAKMAVKFGPDLAAIPVKGVDGVKTIGDMVYQFQHREWNTDIWKVLQAVSEEFDLQTGLTELMYGMSNRQMRSAEESARKFEQVNVRPDDMANCVEDSMGAAAEREKWASRWCYEPADVNSLCGIAGAYIWQTIVLAQPPERVLDLQARIEADSIKKPNRSLLNDSLQQMMTVAGPMLFQAAQAGMLQPFNALMKALTDSMQLRDTDQFLLQMPPQVPVAEDPNRTADREAEMEQARLQASQPNGQ